MRWSYKTVHFELKKDGILGGVFLDESELEQSLNEYGLSGWELISMLEVRDGVIAVFKQALSMPERVPSPIEPPQAEKTVVFRKSAIEERKPVVPPVQQRKPDSPPAVRKYTSPEKDDILLAGDDEELESEQENSKKSSADLGAIRIE